MGSRRWALVSTALLFAFLFFACGDDNDGGPIAVQYDVIASEPRFVVPSDALPPEADPSVSNNNVDILFSGGRLFMAWRTAPTHFASTETRMVIVSSIDGGATWEFEHQIAL